MKRKKEETVFITGASSGIGESLAKLYSSVGYSLVLLARRKEKLELLAKNLKTNVDIISCDINNLEQFSDELEKLEIDILINNAGLALGIDPFHETSMEDIEQVIKTNILGVTKCTHALLPRMVQRKKGYIVNLGSVAGTYPYPGSHVYGATKAFIEQFSLNLRADLLGTGVRVTCISPGITETSFSEVRYKGDKEKSKSVYEKTYPLTPDDIAQIIYYCTTLPPHINVNFLEVMSIHQSFGHFAINRFMSNIANNHSGLVS